MDVMIDGDVLYTCIGKGGRYGVLFSAKGAGTSKDVGDIVIYQCYKTGVVYFRTVEDFLTRMQPIPEDEE